MKALRTKDIRNKIAEYINKAECITSSLKQVVAPSIHMIVMKKNEIRFSFLKKMKDYEFDHNEK